MQTVRSMHKDLDERLEPVLTLLKKQHVEEQLVHRQHGLQRKEIAENLLHRQQQTQLELKLKRLHSAELAHLIETVSPEQRQQVWSLIAPQVRADVLWDLNDTIAQQLVDATDRGQLVAMCRHMDTDDFAVAAEYLPEEVRNVALQTLREGEREWIKASIEYPDNSVGHLMSPDMVSVKETDTLRRLLKDSRARGSFPEQTDRIFVVDQRQRLKGAIALDAIYFHRPGTRAVEIADTDDVVFSPQDKAYAAALAFERYDLISAPVVDERGKLVGRLTVDVVMDFIREAAEDDRLKRDGLTSEADLFAPLWRGARNRWFWLSLNLMTAFVASRVIGLFSGTIEQLVALATLMPIVASVGGNTGNQTVALFVRGLTLGQVRTDNLRILAVKELSISLVNGLVWGCVMGLVAAVVYQNLLLGVVMSGAMLLNLVVAALVGMVVPIVLERTGRDPALGSSVLLTFVTDSMGFFIFLGLARLVLM